MPKIHVIAIFILIRFLMAIGQSTPSAEQKDQTEKVEAEPLAIPVIQITEKADLVHQELQKLNQELEPSKDFADFEADIPLVLDSLKKLQSNKILKELDNLELRVLNALHQEWNLYQGKMNDWKDRLLTASQNVEKKLLDIKQKQIVWELTREEAQKAEAPQALKNRISTVLKETTDAEKRFSKRLNDLLILQNNVSKSQNEINELLNKISESESKLRGQIFVRDSPPLWEVVTTRQDTLHIAGQVQESWTELFRANLTFIKINTDLFYFHIALFILLLLLMLYINKQNRKKQLFNEEDHSLKHSAYFISRPFSAALLIALFLSIWIYPEFPNAVGEFLLLLLLIPVVRLVRGMLIGELRTPFYIMAAIFVFDILQKNAIGFVFMQRMILLFATIAVLIIFIWMLRPNSPIHKRKLTGVAKFLYRISYVLIVILIVSFFSNLYGSVSLAKTLTWGIVDSSHLLVTIYITVTVSTGLITVLIRRRRARAMQFVKTYALKLEKWAKYTISLIGIFLWIRSTLNVFGLLDLLKSWFLDLRETTWTVGLIIISFDAIVDFILILVVTFILIRMIRIFLDLEIFPRLKLPKGLPSAITMMIRYTLVALGIFLALSSIGIDLGKFGILAGALGVGLGFGLQKIVANFISSLILAFGRAIRVGDTLQYQDVFGNVKEIGVNASTVRTFDGSDAIIPNADLISNKVTNWTLLDMQRRMLLPVKVAFGTNPHEVLEILEKVAQKHEDVLNSPEPFAVFNGFGDNFLDFSLYYWIPTSAYFKAKTEIALGVHDAITAKGIQTPRPQRDVRMTTDETADLIKPPVKAKSTRSTRTKK